MTALHYNSTNDAHCPYGRSFPILDLKRDMIDCSDKVKTLDDVMKLDSVLLSIAH